MPALFRPNSELRSLPRRQSPVTPVIIINIPPTPVARKVTREVTPEVIRRTPTIPRRVPTPA